MTSRFEYDDTTILTTFNLQDTSVDVEEDEGVLSKFISKFKTAVSGSQQNIPSSKLHHNEKLQDNNTLSTYDYYSYNQLSSSPAITNSISATKTSTIDNNSNISSVVTFNEKPIINNNSKLTISTSITNSNSEYAASIHSHTLPLTKTDSCDSDDNQSVMTTFSVSNSNSLSRIIGRLRGETPNKEYWMPDENCKECFECGAHFNFFRRKHHCRVCGQIFCSKCASHIIQGELISQTGQQRVCNFCFSKFERQKEVASLHEAYLMSSNRTSLDLDKAPTLSPIVPDQRPLSIVPSMQIPTTSLKQHSDYAGASTPTVALEIPNRPLTPRPSTSISSISHDHLYHHHHHLHHHHQQQQQPPPLQQQQNDSSGNNNSNNNNNNNNSSNNNGLKKLLVATNILRPRSRTNTVTSYMLESAIEGKSLHSPLPFRRNSLTLNSSSFNFNDGAGGTVLQPNDYDNTFTGSDNEDDDNNNDDDDIHNKWDKNPRNVLNFLGGTNNNTATTGDQRPTSMIVGSQSQLAAALEAMMMNGGNINDDEWHDLKNRSKLKSNRERSNSIRRRVSMTSGKPFRTRTQSLMRNVPINNSSLLNNNNDLGSTSLDPSTTPSTPTIIKGLTINNNINNSTNDIIKDNKNMINQSSTNMGENNENNNIVNNNIDIESSLEDIEVTSLPPFVSRPRKYSSSGPITVDFNNDAAIHLRKMVRQILNDTDDVKYYKDQWEDVLVDLLLKVANNVHPDIQGGDEIDVRHYVKIKTIAGGLPKDSLYVNGIVCSKNVAHKQMAKKIENPKILILLFSLEWSRDFTKGEHQFQSIGPVLDQEKEYLEKLINRITALEPTIVLVHGNVSRIALDYLRKANIVVVFNVKLSVLDAVSRCTDASMVSSFIQLSKGSLKLGECGAFELLTLVHEWIPNRRKTFLLFHECPPELGATIILRGGSSESLRTIKLILDFMVFAVHNLRLESSLLHDFSIMRNSYCTTTITTESVDIKNTDNKNEINNNNKNNNNNNNNNNVNNNNDDNNDNNYNDNDNKNSINNKSIDTKSIENIKSLPSSPQEKSIEELVISLRVEKIDSQSEINKTNEESCLELVNNTIDKFKKTIVSTSPSVILPPPYLLLRLKESQKKLITLIKNHVLEIKNSQHINDHQQQLTNFDALIKAVPDTLAGMPTYFRNFDQYLSSDDGNHEYEQLLEEHNQRWRTLDACLEDYMGIISPSYYQQFVVLYTMVCTVTTVPCQEPHTRRIDYYSSPSDLTLGQYIEDMIACIDVPCPSNLCERSMLQHYRSYAHGNARVNVQIEKLEGLQPAIFSNDIYTWSYCRHCSGHTKITKMSNNAWKYSFGKFLELLFYQSNTTDYVSTTNTSSSSSKINDTTTCSHGLYRDHVHFFSIQDIAVRFQYERIQPLDIYVPPMHLYMNSQSLLTAKDDAHESIRGQITRFYDSIVERNKNFTYDVVQPNVLEKCKEQLQEMSERALAEKKNLLQCLQSIYANSDPTDSLQLNIVRAHLQMNVLQWELEYIELVRQYVKPERELRRLTTSHLKKILSSDTDASNNDFNYHFQASDLDFRTKRAIESVDLPLLDVGLDGYPDGFDFGLSSTMMMAMKKDIIQQKQQEQEQFDTTLSQQPQLGESPTTVSPWLEEEQQFDRILKQMEDDHYDATKKRLMEKSGIIHHETGTSINKDNKQTNENENNNNISALNEEVTRRLSLELMYSTKGLYSIFDTDMDTAIATAETETTIDESKFLSKNKNHHRIENENININNNNNHFTFQLTEEILSQVNVIRSKSSPLTSTMSNRYLPSRIPQPTSRDYRNNKKSPTETANKNNNTKVNNISNNTIVMNRQQQQQNKNNINTGNNLLQPPLSHHHHKHQEGNKNKGGSRHKKSVSVSTISSKDSIIAKADIPLKGYRYGYKGSKERLPHSGGQRLIRPRVSSSSSHMYTQHQEEQEQKNYQQKQQNQQQKTKSTGKNTQQRFSLPPSKLSMISTNSNIALPSNIGTSSSTSLLKARTVRQRLSSKSSIEVYTTVKDLVREESDDEFQATDMDESDVEDESDVDNNDNNNNITSALSEINHNSNIKDEENIVNINNRNHDHHERKTNYNNNKRKIFSLTSTDEYDESLCRDDILFLSRSHDSTPTLSHLQQLRGYNKNRYYRRANTVLPHLTFDTEDSFDDTLALINSERRLQQSHQKRHNTLPTISDLQNTNLELDTSSIDLNANITERSSFIKVIANILAEKGLGNLLPLEYPLLPTEHVFPKSIIVVREDEPSTIIAAALTSDDYTQKLDEVRSQYMEQRHGGDDVSTTTGGEYNEKLMAFLENDNVNEDVFIERTLRSKSGIHMKSYFTDGTTKFFCKILFAEQFDALRRNCGCERSYINSLAHCAKWDSSGGKSGSLFLKTKDGRFILKQISSYEMDAFLKFAPSYFQYMSEAFFHVLPTVLCKIFGIYRIGYKNMTTGKSIRMDVLVMENLFYDRSVQKIFDLKGSMRNRHVQVTGKENEVLLDENMVEYLFQSPLFLRSHAKQMLRESLHNDTLFLSRMDVMDYSLLVGIDEEKQELVVGIVDFIRTFTWDKKLESWVKDSGIFGGGGKEPTIISPRQYRIRFREAMDRYFLMIPDFWTSTNV